MTDPLIAELIAARDSHRPIAPPSATRAFSVGEAYELQDRLREALVARGEHSLAWIANHRGRRGLGLAAGDVVTTGSVSTLLRPKAGDVVRASHTRLGSVGVRFA